MVTCPKCSASLPDWAKNCQFCGTDVTKVARPVEVKEKKNYGPTTPKWVWVAYYLVSAYFILSGVLGVIASIMATSQKMPFTGEAQGYSVGVILGIIFGALTVLVGIGLMLRIELARGIVNFICGMKILCGLAEAGFTLMGSLILGPIFLFVKVLDIVTAGFMIYLIGETEKGPPNL